MPENFNPGGHPDIFDSRDYQWSELGAAAPFDWQQGYDVEAELAQATNTPDFKLAVNDQNGSFSCGGQAASKYNEVLETLASATYERRSAKFVYSQVYAPGGGSRGRDLCDLLKKQGCSTEVLLSSCENGQPPTEAFMERSQDITDAARQDAKTSEELSYAQVYPDIDAFAQAIKANHGMILGISGENNGTWYSAFPKPPSKKVWGHWVYAGKAKLIDGKKYIGILNSWGADVGEGGWQWIGEDYFNAGFVWISWTLVFNQNSLSKVQLLTKELTLLQILKALYLKLLSK